MVFPDTIDLRDSNLSGVIILNVGGTVQQSGNPDEANQGDAAYMGPPAASLLWLPRGEGGLTAQLTQQKCFLLQAAFLRYSVTVRNANADFMTNFNSNSSVTRSLSSTWE